MRVAVWVVIGCMSAAAYADTPDELVRQGEALAKSGRYSEAIDKFKAADAAEPKASHACLIALAYTRREAWPQAEIFLARCQEAPADQQPEWVPLAVDQLRERLRTVNVAEIELAVEPAGEPVELSVSSFAPDERFKPRTIHLPPGHHVVTARATGYVEIQQPIDVNDRTRQHVVIRLQKAPPPRTETRRGMLSWYVLGAGGAITASAVAYHVLAYKPAYDALKTASDTMDPASFYPNEAKFKFRQRVVWSLYGAGLATLLAGVALRIAGVGDTEVEITPTAGGGVVSLGWEH